MGSVVRPVLPEKETPPMKNSVFSLAGVLPLTAFCLAMAMPQPLSAQAGHDQALQADVQHSLSNSRFADVQIDVHGGVVALRGRVANLGDKMDAEKKASKAVHGMSIEDSIVIGNGERVNDEALRQTLSKKLIYDRVGYGTTTFNAIAIGVRDGVVTISGLVVDPVDKESAISLIEHEKGVQGIVDHLKVAPVSDFDDRIRQQEARAIYGEAQLNKYALNPAKPIRIAVENGHVTLVGVVDNQGDKNIAGIRANGVPGVFSVTNDLQVAGQSERER
jgi:hyperosmotically inducible protein